jgi:hypothetical protein
MQMQVRFWSVLLMLWLLCYGAVVYAQVEPSPVGLFALFGAPLLSSWLVGEKTNGAS